MPESPGRSQMTLAELSASGSQPQRMYSGGWLPAALPSQAWGKLPNTLPQKTIQHGRVPRVTHGGVSPAKTLMMSSHIQRKRIWEGTSGTGWTFLGVIANPLCFLS